MSSKPQPHNRRQGFTLIELLVVIAIIGILSAVVLSSLNTARSKGRDARREQELKSLQTALELYRADNGSYPQACAQNVAWSSWGACWNTFLASKYISRVPVDPQNVDLGNCNLVANCHIYQYCYLNSGRNYVLAVNLENAPTPSNGNPSSAGCANGGPNWYWVGN